jgi:hypothetical protein
VSETSGVETVAYTRVLRREKGAIRTSVHRYVVLYAPIDRADPCSIAVVAISDMILIATPLYLTRRIAQDRAIYGRLAAVFVMGGSTTFTFMVAGVLVLIKDDQGALCPVS